ncbi:MAG: outer membrane beta-barrel protein, partial [Terrimicrobiaceae bacterium]|nr:outer membrane beta-barrel protein [Terrimicrobiaceae bacterium]
KFSTVTGYQGYANYYLEDELNDTLSFWSSTFKQSFRWLLLPKTTVVAEYRANPIIYTGGADLNSFGNFALVGFDQIFNPRFKWTARLGLEQRFNQNPVDGNSTYFGPYGESNLSYQFGPASTLSWNARYGTEPSGLTNVTQRQTFRTGIAVTHAFTPRISANLGFNFGVDYFDQSGVIDTFTETIFDVALGVNFKINRTASLSAGYQFVDVMAPQNIAFEYTRNVVFVGANLNF